ncbi:MAG TPA: hypothetical protein VEA40_06760 [Ramlibacter sp.]|nr:hypothetical protein [Ramlibacter sp.]
MLSVLRLVKRDEPLVTELDPIHTPIPDLVQEYRAVLANLLARIGLADAHVEMNVRHTGTAPDGLPVMGLKLRMTRWSPQSLKLLVGLPLLEKAAWRALRGSWVLEASHFGGVWLHASSSLEIPAGQMKELRAAIAGVQESHEPSQAPAGQLAGGG